MSLSDWERQWQSACRGAVPVARKCDDELDLSFWFSCFARACRPVPERVVTFVVVTVKI